MCAFKRTLLLFIYLCVSTSNIFAQKTIPIDNSVQQYKFTLNEIEYLEDSTNKLSFEQVRALNSSFKSNLIYYPVNKNRQYTYWYKIRLRFTQAIANKSCLFELFDQTTENITAYIPNEKGDYVVNHSGARVNFSDRLYHHKNFEFLIQNTSKGEYTYYFKLKSNNPVKVIIVYRTLGYFIQYALSEYLVFGLFYGMILIFCFHNLLMFTAVRKKQYLYYVFYILSVALYEMSVDGIAFQYIWPGHPAYNDYVYGIALYAVSICALIFTKELLQVKLKAYNFYRLLNAIIVLRSVYFLYCLFIDKSLFIYKFVEIVPLSMAFVTGIYIYKNGFKPARFFVLAYAVLFTGFIVKAIDALGYANFLPAFLTYYSIGFCFILEMLFLSFAIGDQVRIIRKEKDNARDEIIRQMDINNKLKDSINKELEMQVNARTKELIRKSEELEDHSKIIEEQNQLLVNINHQLEEQSAEISRMNILLEKDNVQLKTDIDKVTEARALSTELNFEEFSAKYPDQESCYKFLAELKWKADYTCTRCSHSIYNAGRAPYSRRCTKCSYEESAMHNTIFENNRIPINKAFYIVYLIYSSKGTISSHQLSQKLGIRQSTCWSYAIRIKKAMQDHKTLKKKGNPEGWVSLVM
ncbi:MAG: chromosome partitioning protein ParA [Mucilaginibacter sp.]|nr:chromosome partitioning protein ParA [Mucilaginibacter sp.]